MRSSRRRELGRPDPLSPQGRSERMRRIKSANTAPELIVRRGLFERGFRYRLHDRRLPGRPDIVLRRYRTAIFVNGCFWHAHVCQKGRIPWTRSSFWSEKFESNRRRDQRVKRALGRLGWKCVVVWECQLKTPRLREQLLERISKKIRQSGAQDASL